MLSEELGQHRSRNARLVELAIQVQTRCHDGGLDGVQHVEAIGHLTEAVPLAAFFAGIAANDPVFCAADAFFNQILGAPNFEPPVFAVLCINFAHGTSEVQSLGNAFFDQCRAAWWLHHGSSHIATCNDAVLRAGAGVHQVSLVEQVPVQFGVL